MSNSPIYTIYKATNTVNGKCYIGFTANLIARKSKHKTTALKNISFRSKNVFYNAIRKHGWESFEWEVLYQSTNKEHTLKEMEGYFIKEHNSYFENGFGYNMSYGGETRPNKGTPHTSESKKKISKANKGNDYGKANKGKKLSKETKEKISQSNKGREVWNKGVPFSLETRRKMSNSKKGKSIKNSGQFKKGKQACPEFSFKKGQAAWNKGNKTSEETRKKQSESRKKYLASLDQFSVPE